MLKIAPEQLHSKFPGLSQTRELKKGGQKVVYDGEHDKYGKVVLKIVNHDGSDVRVQREIDIVSTYKFSNVPTIFEAGSITFDVGSFLYILEQRIEGVELRSLLREGQSLPLSMALKFLKDILSTIVTLEEHGIVHRDIKPENVLCDQAENFWLIDFGIAKDMRNVSLTATNAFLGPHTAGYAAPEQFRNYKQKIDSRADLFSVGVVAYEMLYGRNPFAAGTDDPIDILQNTEAVLEAPLQVAGVYGNEVSRFIGTLMQKLHIYRPPSAKIALSWFLEINKKIQEEGRT